MRRKIFFFFLFIGMIAGPSCRYHVEEELYPDTGCDTNDVTYSGTVLTIIENSCIGCHSQSANNGGVTLEGYSNLKVHVDNGRLLGAIRRDPGFAPMPQGQPRLPECTIEKIEAWIDDGAQNN